MCSFHSFCIITNLFRNPPNELVSFGPEFPPSSLAIMFLKLILVIYLLAPQPQGLGFELLPFADYQFLLHHFPNVTSQLLFLQHFIFFLPILNSPVILQRLGLLLIFKILLSPLASPYLPSIIRE